MPHTRPREPPEAAPRGDRQDRREPEPPSPEDRRLAVASAVGNRALAGYLTSGAGAAAPAAVLARTADPPTRAVLARAPGDGTLKERLAAGESLTYFDVPDLFLTPLEKRLELIEVCNRTRDDDALEVLWQTLGDNLGPVASAHWDLFKVSLDIAPGLDDIPAVDKLEERFRDDVAKEALRRLGAGEKLVAAEIERLEGMEELSLEEQMGPTYELQQAAYQFERAQQAGRALRGIRVRGDQMGKRMDVTKTREEWFVEPAYFDPNDPPESTTYDDPATDPWVGLPLWNDVKWLHDELTGAMWQLAEAQPALHVAAGRGNIHDIAIAPEPRYIIEAALEPVRASQTAIAAAQVLIQTGDLDPLNLDPVVEALRFGHIISESRTPWPDLFYRWVVSETIGEHHEDETIHRLLMQGAILGLILVGSWVGGGLGLALAAGGAALGGYQAVESWQRYNALSTAEGAKGRIGDDLVAPGVAAAARTTAIIDTVMAFINLLPVAALAKEALAARAAAGEAAGAGAAAGAAGEAAGAGRAAAGAGEATQGAAGAGATAARPPAVPPPQAAAGGAGGGATAMSQQQVQGLAADRIRLGVVVRAEEVEVADLVTFGQAYRNAGGVGAIPHGFVDPRTGRIWVLMGQDSPQNIFHEAVHSISIKAGARNAFLDEYGSFLEEGITEALTRQHFGLRAAAHPYDPHVAFLDRFLQHTQVSRSTLMRGYLDGELEGLRQAILRTFNGDGALTGSFVGAMRNVGTMADNTAALRDAVYLMIAKRPPPTP